MGVTMKDYIAEYIKMIHAKHRQLTKEVNISRLKNYLKVVNGKPTTYFSSDRDYAKDIDTMIDWLEKKLPMTKRAYLSTIKNWMEFNDVALFNSLRYKMIFKAENGSAETVLEDRPPSNEELKKILYHADLLEKALFLVMSSSGLRRGEVVQIELDDLDMSKNPVIIHVRKEVAKLRKERVTFISNEARDVLKEWLRGREDYIEFVSKRYNYGKIKRLDDKRVFPISAGTTERRWTKLLVKAKLNMRDEKTSSDNRKGILIMRLHTLRKFMISRLQVHNELLTKRLVGHKYSRDEYSKQDIDVLAKFYKENVNTLLVFTKEPNVELVKKLDNKPGKDIVKLLLDEIERQQITIDSLKNGVDQSVTVSSGHSEREGAVYSGHKRSDGNIDKKSILYLTGKSPSPLKRDSDAMKRIKKLRKMLE